MTHPSSTDSRQSTRRVDAVIARTGMGAWTVTVEGKSAVGRLRDIAGIAESLAGPDLGVTLVWPAELARHLAHVAQSDTAYEMAQQEAAAARVALAAFLRGPDDDPQETVADIGSVMGLSHQRVSALLQRARSRVQTGNAATAAPVQEPDDV